MGYDASRPVPWRRLLRETLLLVVVGSFIFLAILKEHDAGTFAGLALGGVLYLLIGAFLSKFGYQRKSLRELRAESDVKATAKAEAKQQAVAAAPRQRPAPTKRTGGGTKPRPRPR